MKRLPQFAFLLLAGWLNLPTMTAQQSISPMVDTMADSRTQALYRNLHGLQGKGIMFGHQDDLAYGIGWKEAKLRSDVADVSGSFPAVYGWELSKLGKQSSNIDTVDFGKMRKWIQAGYEMGGMITICWHLDNPVSGGDAWDNTPAVPAILPGGELHSWYQGQLDLIAEFMLSLEGGSPKAHIPVVFRPFHEQSGGWFWWGTGHRSPEQYQQLWRFTVEYLRDTKGVHNLLYAYSPDVVNSKEQYLMDYPGDAYVDVLGLDDYADFRPGGTPERLTERLRMLGEIAMERGKLFALTETGFELIPQHDWWTASLLRHIEADPIASRISWMLVWRNGRPDHYYAPFPGHPSAADFIKFRDSPSVLFVEELPDLYK
ncbi:MAG: glycoside hydrolase family 26 protein [Bacteroidia bacterium]|nr:glycoside hydrolase family 26 protein [Bacteroidia bacterium]